MKDTGNQHEASALRDEARDYPISSLLTHLQIDFSSQEHELISFTSWA